MSLATINLRLLSDLQKIDLINRLIAILIPLAADDSQVAEMIEILKVCIKRIEAARAWKAKSELSEKITEQDEIRDEALGMIDATATLYRRKTNKNLRDAAELVGSIYDDVFDGVSLNNNGEETPAVDLFLEKIAGETAAEAIQTLRLTTEVEVIAAAHPTYKTLLAERDAIKANDDTVHLVQTRSELKKEFDHLVSYMNYKSRRGSEVHMNAIKEMNEPIKAVTATAKAEQTRKESVAE